MKEMNFPDFENIKINDATIEAMIPHLALLLNKTGLKVLEQVNIALSHLEIKAMHFSVLLAIDQFNEKISQKEIGAKLLIDRNTMVKIIDHMELKGFVKRKTDPKDRRSYLLCITNKGKTVLENVQTHILGIKTDFFISLSNKDKKELTRLLMKLMQTH